MDLTINSDTKITETLHIYDELRIQRGATLECIEDVHAVEIHPGGFVTGGGTIKLSHPESTSACLYLNATDKWFTREDSPTGVDNIKLENAGIGKGQCIYMEAFGKPGSTKADYRCIEWVRFSNLTMVNCEDGILLKCHAADGDSPAFINGNTFSNLFIDNFNFGYRSLLSGDGNPSINKNIIRNYMMQSGPETNRALLDNGHGQLFDGIIVFDFNWGDIAIEINGGGTYLGFTNTDKIAIKYPRWTSKLG